MKKQTSSRTSRPMHINDGIRSGLICLMAWAILFPYLFLPFPAQANFVAAKTASSVSDNAMPAAKPAPENLNHKLNTAQTNSFRYRQSVSAQTIEKPSAQTEAAPPAPGYGGILFMVGNSYSQAIVKTNPDGTNSVNLTDLGSAQIAYPSVSSQTGMIAFQSGSIQLTPPLAGRYDNRIFVMNGDGSGVRQLTFYPGTGDYGDSADYNPVISPDGTKVAFISKRAVQNYTCRNTGVIRTSPEVFIVNVDGTNLQQVTSTDVKDTTQAPPGDSFSGACYDANNNYAVAWSSDSKQLAVLGPRYYVFKEPVDTPPAQHTQGSFDGISVITFKERIKPTDSLIVSGSNIAALNIPYPYYDPDNKEPVTKARIASGVGFFDWSPNGKILFNADFGDPFRANYENSNSLGFVAPSGGGGGFADYKIAQDLVGVVGFNGSTDGNPHGGQINGEFGGARYSPDGSQIVFSGNSPRANNGSQQRALFIVSSQLNDKSIALVPNTGGALNGYGLAWAAGAAIPKPDKLVLAPNPALVYEGKPTQIIPTLLDALGNVIARAALWRDFFDSCPTCGIVCDSQHPCNSTGYTPRLEVDFAGNVTGNSTSGYVSLCGSNAGITGCTVVGNNVVAVSLSAPTPNAFTSGRNGPGVFTITRTGETSATAVINFTLSGSAVRDVDYTLDFSGNTVTLPAGQASVDIKVRPLPTQGDKTITLTLQPDSSNAYFLAPQNAPATITIKDDGSAAAVKLLSMTPNTGGNGGDVSAIIYGQNIKAGAIVKLARSGQTDILGDAVFVSATGSSISAVFNLIGKAQGTWDVVVTNPDNSTAKLPNGFTIQPNQAASVWVDLMGRDTIRASHSATTYTLLYGNRGNVDAYMVPLFVTGIPKGAEVKALFDVSPINGQAADEIVPPVVSSDTGQGLFVVVPFVPANVTKYLRFSIRFSGIAEDSSFTLKATALQPLVKAVGTSSSALASGTGADKSTSSAAIQDAAPPKYELDRAALACIYSLITDVISCALSKYVDIAKCAENIGSFLLSAFNAAFQQKALNSDVNVFSGGSLVAGFVGTVLSCAKAAGKAIPFYQVISLAACALGLINDAYSAFYLNGCGGVSSAAKEIKTVKSFDPNEKVGSPGTTNQHYISGAEPSRYAVFFENKAEASAPAQTVVVTDQLDASKLDLSTFSLGLIGFGEQIVNVPPGLKSYNTDVDLRPAKNLIVRIQAALDSSTGVVTWKFISIDPTTNQATTDPLAGFLPPNKTGTEGEGSVLFTVMPKAGLASGTQISNKANILFDLNASLDTNTFTNTIDNSNPSSRTSALTQAQSSIVFNVNWSGTDTGSGIRDYTVYVSENGGAYSVWLDHTTQASAFFIGQPAKTYSFFTVATDSANNQEAAKTVAEASTSTPTNIQTSIDDARFFVHQQYLDFLNREPDQGGFDYWTNLITKCAATDTKCISAQRVSVSAAFFIEQEFQDTGSFVYRFYKGSLGRQPAYDEFVSDRSRVIGGANLEASKVAFAEVWTQRAEFLAKYPQALTQDQFVDALLQTTKQTSGVDLTSQRQSFINQLQNGGTRAEVIRAVVDAKAFQAAEYNRAFVLMQYFGYLRRDPDTSGYNFWLDILNNRVPNNYRSMVCAFINSAEYQLRFGSAVTHTDAVCAAP